MGLLDHDVDLFLGAGQLGLLTLQEEAFAGDVHLDHVGAVLDHLPDGLAHSLSAIALLVAVP